MMRWVGGRPENGRAAGTLEDRGLGSWLAHRLQHAGQVSGEGGYRDPVECQRERRGGGEEVGRKEKINFKSNLSRGGSPVCLCIC